MMDSNNPKDELPTLDDLINEARQYALAGDFEKAFEVLFGAIRFAEEAGHPETVMSLVETLVKIVDSDQFEPESKAWLFNSKGLALQSLGNLQASTQSFRDMQEIGITISNKQIVATSEMNLGSQALLSGNLKLARHLFEHSLKLNHELGNYRQAIQIRLNCATIDIQTNELDAAEAQLSTIRELIEFSNDPHLLATLFGVTGTIFAKRGDFNEAQVNYDKALKNARRSGDTVSEINTLQNLAALKLDEGLPKRAIRRFRRALKLAEMTDSIMALESVCSGLAIAYYQTGALQKAADMFEQASYIAGQLGNHDARARYIADIGAILLTKNDLKLAKQYLHEALSTFQKYKNKKWEYRVLRNLMNVYWVDGEGEKALQIARQALKAIHPKSHEEKAELFSQIAKLFLSDISGLRQASYYFKRQLYQIKNMNKMELLAWHSALAGSALAQSGGLNLSIPFYTRAIDIYTNIDDDHMAFHSLNDRAIAFSDLGRHDKAINDFMSCMDLANKYDDRVMKVQTLLNWGETSRRKGDTKEAISKLRTAVQIARRLADRTSEAESLANLGIALSDAKRWDEAQDVFRKARDIARYIKQRNTEASALGGLAGVAFTRGHYKIASNYYEKAAQKRLPEDRGRQFIEDLGGLIESLAAAGVIDKLRPVGQQLVDAAQFNQETELASEALMRSARWLLRQEEYEEAVGLYAAGIVIAGIGPEKSLIERLSKACLMMAFHIDIEADNSIRLYEQVIEQLNNSYKGIGKSLRDFIDLARNYVTESAEDGTNAPFYGEKNEKAK